MGGYEEMLGPPRARELAKWALGGIAVVAGGYLLIGLWGTSHAFAVNVGRGRPPGDPEVIFWYALPGFEAGLLAGLLPAAASHGVGRLLRLLNLAIWGENAANLGIFVYIESYGVLLGISLIFFVASALLLILAGLDLVRPGRAAPR